MTYTYRINSFVIVLLMLAASIKSQSDEPMLVIEYPTTVTGVFITSDEDRIVVGGIDGVVCVMDIESGSILQKIDIPGGGIDILDISNDDKYIAVKEQRGMVAVMNMVSGQKISDTTIASKARFLSDPSKIALTYGRAGAGLWDINKGEECLKVDINTIMSPLDISPDDSLLALGFGGGIMDARFGNTILWDLKTGKQKYVLEEDISYSVDSVCFSPSGRWLLTGHAPSIANAEANLWDLETGRLINRYVVNEIARNTINAYFSPDEEKVVLVLPPRVIRILDLHDGNEIAEYEIGNYKGFALSSRGNCFAVWSKTEIQIWAIDLSSDIDCWMENK